MSLSVDKDGNALVLDQVNGRLVRVGKDGRPRGTIGLPVSAAQDIAVTDDGKIAVLDRLSDKTVAIMGEDGKVIGRLPIEGKGVEEAGGVTAVFADGKNIYAEYEHGALVLLGDTSGRPSDDRTQLPGRPSRDGKTIWSTGITDGPSGRLWLSAIDRATMQNRFTRELRMGMPVDSIRLLDTDKQGIVYLATVVEAGQEALLLTCISPNDGHPLGSVQLPANTLPEESLRDLAVLDEGGVLYQHRTEDGVTIGRYDCR
jgi:outer membrane protein assembly factor BamB